MYTVSRDTISKWEIFLCILSHVPGAIALSLFISKSSNLGKINDAAYPNHSCDNQIIDCSQFQTRSWPLRNFRVTKSNHSFFLIVLCILRFTHMQSFAAYFNRLTDQKLSYFPFKFPFFLFFFYFLTTEVAKCSPWLPIFPHCKGIEGNNLCKEVIRRGDVFYKSCVEVLKYRAVVAIVSVRQRSKGRIFVASAIYIWL